MQPLIERLLQDAESAGETKSVAKLEDAGLLQTAKNGITAELEAERAEAMKSIESWNTTITTTDSVELTHWRSYYSGKQEGIASARAVIARWLGGGD